jgi:hypothetical protein
MLHSLTNPRCLTSQKREDLRELIDISFDIDTRHILVNALSLKNIELLKVKKLWYIKETLESGELT